MLIRLLNQTSRTHIGPGSIDIVQADLTGGSFVDGAPTCRCLNEHRPQRILALIINQYNKSAVFVIKQISHVASSFLCRVNLGI